ncbi:MAG: nucleotidyltransferase domain-containing protein [Clostridiales bacterium]|nr:nucleotidyltransferase domain-containing protein [Clostridiales bacterium]
MFIHHRDSIEIMIKHYRQNPEISALFLIGSVATGLARADSDIDGVAVVPHNTYIKLKAAGKLEEVEFGKCTYDGGYFNIHYVSREVMQELDENGSEPMRNMFCEAKTLFCGEPGLPELAAKIAVYPKKEKEAKQFRFYCMLKMLHTYFWISCKPEGFFRRHTANLMVCSLYRLILAENEILFPSMRKLEEYAAKAPDKPEGIIKKCENFLNTLTDTDAADLVKSYEKWTAYNYPKDHDTVMNNFSDPYEWM